MEIITIYLILGISLLLIIANLKLIFRPDKTGRIVKIDNICNMICSGNAESRAKSRDKKNINSAINIEVDTGDSQIIKAELSPCVLCIEKIKEGDIVGITKTGKRWIAQKTIGNLKCKINN
jgi:hypothetical protein